MWLKQSQGIIIVLKTIFANYLFFHLIIWVLFPYAHLTAQIFILNNLFCLFSCDFLQIFKYFFLSILMVIISLELTRVNSDRNIFSINVELTSTFLLYRGLVHYHHQILNIVIRTSKQYGEFQLATFWLPGSRLTKNTGAR